MKVIKNELSVFVDCDNTLLNWDNPTVEGIGKLPISFAGKTVYLTPHQYHVDLVKTYRERGYYVTVWSANGWNHALRVVEALKLEEFVDSVQVKPTKHMDDSPDAAAILGPRVFCEDFTKSIKYFVPRMPPGTVILTEEEFNRGHITIPK